MKRAWHQQFELAPKHLRTSPDGIVHRSVSEGHRWSKLQLDEKLGLIRGLRRQVRFPLDLGDGRQVLTPTGKVSVYTCDFIYSVPDQDPSGAPIWREVIEDHKGYMDKVAELRIAVFEAIYQKKVYIHKY